jgi:hypothetical protein
MAGWLISDVWLTYLSSPLIVTFEPFETTIDKIPFPAITSMIVFVFISHGLMRQ